MKLLVDLTSVVGGGGLEQSTALLEGLRSASVGRDVEIICAARAGGKLAEFAAARGMRCVQVPPSLRGRAMFSLFSAARIIRRESVDAVYVAFGIGLDAPHGCPQVINVAYPIICYPDSPYWAHLPAARRLQTRIKTLMRARLIRSRATQVIAECGVMRDRLVEHAGMAVERVRIVPPIIGRVARAAQSMTGSSQWAEPRGDRGLRVLFITGADPHKNLWRLPAVADRLHARGVENIRFALTVTEASFRASCGRSGLCSCANFRKEYFEFLGPTFGDDLARHVLACDVLANISDLESISNNFIEAVAARRPMLISARDFALCSVRTPYVACEPHDPDSVASAVVQCIEGRYAQPLRVDALAIDAFDRAQRVLAIVEEALTR